MEKIALYIPSNQIVPATKKVIGLRPHVAQEPIADPSLCVRHCFNNIPYHIIEQIYHGAQSLAAIAPANDPAQLKLSKQLQMIFGTTDLDEVRQRLIFEPGHDHFFVILPNVLLQATP